jgi:hypothetical protein
MTLLAQSTRGAIVISFSLTFLDIPPAVPSTGCAGK